MPPQHGVAPGVLLVSIEGVAEGLPGIISFYDAAIGVANDPQGALSGWLFQCDE